MYWRGEILQALFWLHEEGLGDEVGIALLQRFLGDDADIGVGYLDRLLDDGSVGRFGDRFKLSAAGARAAELEFAASFEEVMWPTDVDCRPGPWCPGDER